MGVDVATVVDVGIVGETGEQAEWFQLQVVAVDGAQKWLF